MRTEEEIKLKIQQLENAIESEERGLVSSGKSGYYDTMQRIAETIRTLLHSLAILKWIIGEEDFD